MRTDSNSSLRLSSKCSQSARDTSMPALGQLGLEDLLHQRHARAALRSGAGAGLQLAEVGAGFAVLAADQLADRAGRDVVAGADLRVVGQREPRRRLGAGRRRDTSAGSPGSSRPSSGRSERYGVASPTKIPPSRVFASALTTSFW